MNAAVIPLSDSRVPLTGPASFSPVVFVNLQRNWGGGEQWHFATALALSKRGWPVALIVRPGSALEARASAEGIQCLPIGLRASSLLNPFKVARVVRGLRRLRPGAVILNGMRELKSVGVIARLVGVPKVILRRGIPQPATEWVALATVPRVPTRLIVNSQATLEALASAYKKDRLIRLRPLVIYNGLDPSGFVPPPGRESSLRIVAVGRLEREKGYDLLIRALPRVLRCVPQVQLRIVGDGSQRAALESLASILGVGRSVEFTGESQRVSELLRDCDLFAMPSRYEGFGFAMVEGMLMELPVVGFAAAAMKEVVVHGLTGILVPPEDVESLAAALIELLEHPQRARDLGKAGRARALSRFTIDRATDDLERLLREP
jgi:glycosyltransferase involved in cell wall biosynthesis